MPRRASENHVRTDRDRQRVQTREKLYEAALEVFRRDGVLSCTNAAYGKRLAELNGLDLTDPEPVFDLSPVASGLRVLAGLVLFGLGLALTEWSKADGGVTVWIGLIGGGVGLAASGLAGLAKA